MLLVPLGVPRLDLVDERGLGRDTAPKALTTQMAEFDLRHVEPTTMLGGIMDLSFICDSFCLRGGKCFIKRGCGMGMKIIHHEADFLCMRIMVINKFLDKVCPINFCPLLSDFGMTLTSSWFKSHKNVCGPIALILCSISQRLPRCRWKRSTDFTNQWGRHCIHTPLRTRRIVRFFINISDFFPLADKGGILLWRKTPCFLLPGFTFVFFHVRRTVSWDIESTISNATIVSASLRKVHRS